MKTTAIAALFAAAVAASPAHIEKRASIQSVTVKGNGATLEDAKSNVMLLTNNAQLSSLATSVSIFAVSTISQVRRRSLPLSNVDED